MKTRTFWVFALIAFLVIPGCASLFNNTSPPVAMQSNPTGAEVWINGTQRGTTPLTLELPVDDSYTIVFKRDGYDDTAYELTSSAGGGWIILDVLGGLVPVIIDAATGAWNEFSTEAINVTLPALPSSGDDHTLKRIY